ncbi:MAG: response regulator transcription factor [Salaquimonas sp.]|jgi:DNA-binding NarL/FixJ family response regulator|nr:response regulator transcription factor [Salaquimonas sp.]
MGLIIVADDHPLFRDALRQAIDALASSRTIETAGDMGEVERLAGDADEVDLVLLDLAMPGSKGLSGLIRLRAQHPEIPVVVVSATEDSATIRRALELGASGFIPKSSGMAEIRAAVTAVLEGEIWAPSSNSEQNEEDVEFAELAGRLKTLTPQQGKVLGMLGEGLLNKQIAYELGVSEATVKAHVSAVLLKLGVESRTQAVIVLGRLGLAAGEELAG